METTGQEKRAVESRLEEVKEIKHKSRWRSLKEVGPYRIIKLLTVFPMMLCMSVLYLSTIGAVGMLMAPIFVIINFVGNEDFNGFCEDNRIMLSDFLEALLDPWKATIVFLVDIFEI